MEVTTMQEARKNQPREAKEDLIDSLIAISLLTRRMAQLLDIQIHQNDTTTQKGEMNNDRTKQTER